MVVYQLSRPFAYLVIRDESKAKIDWLVPIFLTIPTVPVFLMLSDRPQIFMANGVLSQVSGLMQNLPGFYLTALAAIATFNRPDLDYLLPKPTPTVQILHQGKWEVVELTRRRMLTMQFGYLTVVSLLLFGVAVVANAIAPTVKSHCPTAYTTYTVGCFVGVYSYAVWHLITITLFGLYQLSERIHQPNSPE